MLCAGAAGSAPRRKGIAHVFIPSDGKMRGAHGLSGGRRYSGPGGWSVERGGMLEWNRREFMAGGEVVS